MTCTCNIYDTNIYFTGIVLLVCISIFTGGLLRSNKNTVKTVLDGGAISNYINCR